jgi:hypothetical protein
MKGKSITLPIGKKKSLWCTVFNDIKACDNQGFLFLKKIVKGICLKDFDTINLLKHVK